MEKVHLSWTEKVHLSWIKSSSNGKGPIEMDNVYLKWTKSNSNGKSPSDLDFILAPAGSCYFLNSQQKFNLIKRHSNLNACHNFHKFTIILAKKTFLILLKIHHNFSQ